MENPYNADSELNNNFVVKGCQIFGLDQPKPFTFLLSGRLDAKLCRTLERFFCTKTQDEWRDWLSCIQEVGARLGSQGRGHGQGQCRLSQLSLGNAEQDGSIWDRFQERRFSHERGKVKMVGLRTIG